MAGGMLLYVIKELFAGIRHESAQKIIMTAVIFGFSIGWGTELVTTMAETHSPSSISTSGDMNSNMIRDPDGDVISIGNTANSKLALGKSEIAREEQAANDMLHEKAMVPTILPDGTKQFVLIASVFSWSPYPGEVVQAWGYNKQVPDPLLRFQVGDKIAIVLQNRLPQPTTLHLHGLAVPNSMDGVPTMSMDGMNVGTQPAIKQGDSFTCRFTVTPQMGGTICTTHM
jgi:manganese oxidase